MTDAELYRPADSLAGDGWELLLTPDRAGWTWSGLRVAALAPGGRIRYDTGHDEAIVLPLSGSCRVTRAGEIVWEFWNPEVSAEGRRPIYRCMRYPAERIEPLLARGR